MKKRILYIGLLITFISVASLIYINNTLFLNEQKSVYDNLNKVLIATIKNSKQDLLSISSTLAQTQILKDSIIQDNSDLTNEFLQQMNAQLHNSFQNNQVFIKVLTPNKIYGQEESTSNTVACEDNYAQNLNMIKNSKSTIVDVTTNDYLKLKATTPILHNDKLLGFVEVFALYDVLVQKMRANQIELVPLLNKTMLKKSYSVKEQHSVGTDWMVATNNYNQNLLKKLATLLPNDVKELFSKEYLYKNNLFFASFDLHNNRGVVLGKYVLILNTQSFEMYNNAQHSFLENIITINNSSEDFYNFVKHKEENMFMNIEKGYIKNLKDVVDKRDKTEFEEVARQKLMKLSKEELVDFIMQQSKHSEIRGEIR